MYPKQKSPLVPSTLFLLLIVLSLWISAVGAAPSRTCSVPGDFVTIQDAVDDATCETINVGSGIFSENVTVNRMVTIAGKGAASTEVNGSASGSVFTISSSGEVTLVGLTISNGSADYGAGISNTGTVILEDSTLSDNSAFVGGGIYNFGGTVTVDNSTINNNSADAGGGIYNADGFGAATLTISDSTLSANSAVSAGGGVFNDGEFMASNSTFSRNSANDGGGISNNGGAVTLDNSTFTSNSANDGGAIWNAVRATTPESSSLTDNVASDDDIAYTPGTVTLNNSTLKGNEAVNNGGGIWNAGTATLENSTLSRNEAYDPFNSGSMLGGGIYNDDGGTVNLNSSTLARNSADNGGGGLFNNAGTVNSSSSIVANSGFGNDCGGDTITSLGYNLDSDGTCNLMDTGDISSTDPLLGPLQDNGGDTLTHALLPGSPAIDAGNCPGASADQRGYFRPVEIRDAPNAADACDIGAFEVQNVSYLPVVIVPAP